MSSTVSLKDELHLVEVTLAGKRRWQFPYIWLRENCPCDKCFLPSSRCRQIPLSKLDVNLLPTKATVQDGTLTIAWSDGHSSIYSQSWMERYNFDKEAQDKTRSWYRLPPKLWNAKNMQGNIPEYDFSKLMNDDTVLYQWLCTLETSGIALVSGTPSETGQVTEIANRVAYAIPTHYGDTFHVKPRADAINPSYTHATLALHTDQPWYTRDLGVQLLHFIHQVPVTGGENIFVDGYFAAEQLRQNNPNYFNILSKTGVYHLDIGEDWMPFNKLGKQPTIGLDLNGEIRYIRYSDHGRAKTMDLPVDQVHEFYLALTEFVNLLYHPDNLIQRKSEEGDIICFANERILHGRNGFEAATVVGRHLEGTYIDWDEMRSRRRVLQEKISGEQPGYMQGCY